MLYHDPYFDRTEVSNSNLTSIKKEIIGDNKPPPLEAYRFGNLIDMMITEQHLIDYTNHKCAGELFEEDIWNQAIQMKQSFMADPMCYNMIKLASGQAVTTKMDQLFKYRNWEFYLNVRAKWDLLFRGQGWGADIKSTMATTQSQFEAACDMFDYWRSRVFYMNIIDSDQDMLIGISKVNYKVFKIPIKRGDKYFKKGEQQMNWLALEAWKLGMGQSK